LCDYVIYEKENLHFYENEIINEELHLTEANFNTQFFFGGLTTRSYVPKSTYTPAVLNMYIHSINFVKNLGYEYALLWEYDFILGEDYNKIENLISRVEKNNHDGFFITCKISGIDSIYGVPQIFNVKSFSKYCGNKTIKNAKDFVEYSKMKICEEWVYEYVKTLDNPLKISYDDYIKNFNNIDKNLVKSENDNPSYTEINSGIYLDKNDENNIIYSIYSNYDGKVEIEFQLYENNVLITKDKLEFFKQKWYYLPLDNKLLYRIKNNDSEIKVVEKFYFNNTYKEYITYLNNNNLESFKKGKIFYYHP